MQLTSRQSSPRPHCPLCREDLASLEPRTCEACGTAFHAACFDELGGCAILGCSAPRPMRANRNPAGAARPCDLCGDPFQPLERRLCRCGTTLHDDCVAKHAAGCNYARRLLPQPPPTQPAPRPTSAVGSTTQSFTSKLVKTVAVFVGCTVICFVAFAAALGAAARTDDLLATLGIAALTAAFLTELLVVERVWGGEYYD